MFSICAIIISCFSATFVSADKDSTIPLGSSDLPAILESPDTSVILGSSSTSFSTFSSPAFSADGTIVNSHFGIVANNSSLTVAKQNVQGFSNAMAQAKTLGIENVKVATDTYYVDTSHTYESAPFHSQNSIFIVSGVNLNLNGSTFQQLTNGEQGYSIFAFKQCDSASVFNGILAGDKNTHDYTKTSSAGYKSHEWGFGVAVFGSSNIKIYDMELSNMTGDGIFVGGTDTYLSNGGKISHNIAIRNCNIHDCRRQGISVIGADTMEISNCTFSDIEGTPPGYFIDLENELDWPITNIYIHNNQFGSVNSSDRDAILVHHGTSSIRIADNQIEGAVSVMYGQDIAVTNNLINSTIGVAATADSDEIVLQNNWGQTDYWDLSPSAKLVKSFSAGGYSSWSINHITGNIVLVVPPNINLDSLMTEVVASDNATIFPASGTLQNFSSPVSYTITNSSGNTKQYRVTAYHVSSYDMPFVLSEAQHTLNMQENAAGSFSVFLAAGANGADYAEISSSNSGVVNMSTKRITQNSSFLFYGRQNGRTTLTVRFFNASGEMTVYRKEILVTVTGQSTVSPPVIPPVTVDPISPTPPSGGSSGSSSSGGGAFRADRNLVIVQAGRPFTKASADKLFNEALSNKPEGINVLAFRAKNYTTVDKSVLMELASLANKNGVTLMVHFDTLVDNVVICRMSVNPTLMTTNLDLTVKITGNKITLPKFVVPVEVAVRMPKGMTIDNLKITQNGKELTTAKPWLDKNGYIHFTTTGGELVFSVK